jgi:hypothetical protein
VRSVGRSGGCIGNDDIFKVVLGDGEQTPIAKPKMARPVRAFLIMYGWRAR